MLAIIGLGNPGELYDHTRHNAGFDVVSMLSAKWDIPLKKLKCKALIGEGTVDGRRVALIKPQTFMNESGQSVAEALNWYKLTPKETLIIVDDIDLPFGTVRVRAGGGPGTHNGLRSILQWTGSGDFPRIRVGMGAPPPGWDLANYVLGHFQTQEDRKVAFDAYQAAAQAAECWLKAGIDRAMNQYNRKHAEGTETTD